MLGGEVETLRVPTGCLDVLAQQVVACVAVDRWDVPALFDLVRGAYPYRDLTAGGVRERPAAGLGPVPDRDLPRPPRPGQLGPRPQPPARPARDGPAGPDRRRDDPRHRASTRSTSATAARGSASSTRSSSSSGGSARRSSSGTATWRIEAIEPHRVVVAPAEGQAGRDALLARRGRRRGRPSWARPSARSAARSPAGCDDPGVARLARRRVPARAGRRADASRDYVARQVRSPGPSPTTGRS